MQHIIIYDRADIRAELLPLSYTRPIGAMRLGIDTLAEKWQAMLPGDYSWMPGADYLSDRFSTDPRAAGDPTALFIAGNVVATPELAAAVAALKPGDKLVDADGCEIAHRGGDAMMEVPFKGEVSTVGKFYDLFLKNAETITADSARITSGRTSAPLSTTNTVVGDPSLVFLEPGVTVEGAFLNTTHGPIYVGEGAEIMEGSMLRGPIAICEHATVNMGAKIYGGTTIGPWCKVGGEVNNVVFLGFSNKAHDGFLGNAVIGEWCNLGAGCVASNLKNDYTPIRVWNYPTRRFERTGLQFCGLIMGDHSKAGINTMFNTATVLGVGVNVHGSGFPRPFVPSFSEGSPAGFSDVSMTKFFEIARRMMARRGRDLTEADEQMFYAIRQAAEELK